jgi:MoaA/NifB/PqqE/SkfB family radical SAM enzyme
MATLKSLSLFVGTGECNANCNHCAGMPLRKYAPKKDGIIDEELISKTLEESYSLGAKSLSISSSGEPTLSPRAVTKTLGLLHKYKNMGVDFSPINLYSNGIRIGEDNYFHNAYLPLWKDLGLTGIYVTVHDIEEKENARIYGVKNYPPLKLILHRIHNAGISMRANLILSKKTINNFDKFFSTIKSLERMGVDSISAWPIRNQNDKIDQNLSPLEEELNKIETWIETNQNPKCPIRMPTKKNQELYQTNQKLTLFQNGTLSNTWCNSL